MSRKRITHSALRDIESEALEAVNGGIWPALFQIGLRLTASAPAVAAAMNPAATVDRAVSGVNQASRTWDWGSRAFGGGGSFPTDFDALGNALPTSSPSLSTGNHSETSSTDGEPQQRVAEQHVDGDVSMTETPPVQLASANETDAVGDDELGSDMA